MSVLYTIPQDFFGPADTTAATRSRTTIHVYESNNAHEKSRVTMQKNVFSFLLEGEKVVHRSGEPLRLAAGEFLLISGGNCLMTEKLSLNNRYRSILFFFDDSVLTDLFHKYAEMGGARAAGRGEEPIVNFAGDPFIRNYLDSLQLLLQANPFLQEELRVLKFEELLIYLAGAYPELLFSFRMAGNAGPEDRDLQAVVEGNIEHPVTVEELAFLCNMSISTFKRHFARVYGTSPNKWLLQKRMERAAVLLNQQVKPSEVYFLVGYENHSSFTQSFKQVFGVTPREFQRGEDV